MIADPRLLLHRLGGLFRRLRRETRGNVLMLTGFALVPLTFATGMGIDYSKAMRLQTKLNAVADAAALSAVTQSMMSQPSSAACTTARKMFISQSAGLNGLTLNPADAAQLAITIKDSKSSTSSTNITCTSSGASSSTTASFSRIATVSYRGESKNSFAGVLGISTLTVKGTSTAYSAVAPNIDFYVLLDTSGSMAFPVTSAGITQLRSLTGGCAFACHATNDAKAKDKNGNMTDYYGVATSYGIPLRVHEARKAVQSMMTLATQTAASNKAKYTASLASFAAADPRANNSFRILSYPTSDLASVARAADNAQTSLYYTNNCPKQDYCNNDADTATSDAFTRANSLIPMPGNGTNNSNDKPQAIVFLITDGMRDETRSSGRPEVAIDTQLCTDIKARNIRIAILYTEYLKSSMDGDGWSQDNVVPYLGQVAPALQSCASNGLYYKVTTDEDISDALAELFQKSVATARLTK